MARIVIIGAGLTGISTAYHLEQSGCYDYVLFEAEETIGGLCRSVSQDGFTFDFTGHLLHINDQYFKELLEKLIGFDTMNQIERHAFIYSHQTYTRYPFQINLFGLPPTIISECIEEYVKRKQIKSKKHTFYEWVLQHFGRGLGKNFFFPYQRKIFAYPVRALSSSWTGRFVPSTSLTHIINGAIRDNTEHLKIGYNADFFYPRFGGIFSWVKKFATHLKLPIKTNHRVTKVDMNTKLVHFNNGHTESYTQLISTIPLDTLLTLIKEKPSLSIKTACNNLKCNSVINFNIGLNRPVLSDKHWIYFPEKEFPFYRIGFPHNFSPHLVPAQGSSLYGEFSHLGRGSKWIQKTLSNAQTAAMKLFDFSSHDIATQVVIPIKHAYVIFDHWRDKNLPTLLKLLEENKIMSTGRYGAWKYSSMQEAVLDGQKASLRTME